MLRREVVTTAGRAVVQAAREPGPGCWPADWRASKKSPWQEAKPGLTAGPVGGAEPGSGGNADSRRLGYTLNCGLSTLSWATCENQKSVYGRILSDPFPGSRAAD